MWSIKKCECRNCGKIYDEAKSRGDWKGYCSAKCTHEKARSLGYSKAKEKRSGGSSEYTILHRAGEIGSVFVDDDVPPKRPKFNIFEGFVEVCCHRVHFRYKDIEHKLTDDMKACLEKEAEERAKSQIIEGIREGELNCLYVFDDGTDAEIQGWWSIT